MAADEANKNNLSEAETMMMKGEEALQRLRSVEPPSYLSPSPELCRLARDAARHLYASLVPFCPPGAQPPLERLLADEGLYDAEQVWSQIDLLQSRPILPLLRRHIKKLLQQQQQQAQKVQEQHKQNQQLEEEEEEENEEELEGDDGEEEELDEGDDEEELDEGDDEEETTGNANGVEDKFLKIRELEEFLERGEEEEYGIAPDNMDKKKRNKMEEDEDEDEEEDEEDEDEDDLEEFGGFDHDDDEAEGVDKDPRYKDFFGGKAKEGNNKRGEKGEKSTKRIQFNEGVQEIEMDDEQNDDEHETNNLSTHEKELLKMRAKIEQMEKATLEPKSWTMLGEVRAANRPKNSALEVDLDFDHNVKPAPVITEEVTASLEELIKKRIIEGHFDDAQKPPPLPSKAPKERKEVDETKSKKGLAELYEEEYAQKAGLGPAPLSVSDELKKEASTLFKKICYKLDALSHFHFAPKPVIEDMSIQANVPALAMEEVAPIAVSDAAMLAPEEIFEGKGDVKEEGELTQAERRRRRANKKRRFKAETAKRAAKRSRVDAISDKPNGQEIAA